MGEPPRVLATNMLPPCTPAVVQGLLPDQCPPRPSVPVLATNMLPPSTPAPVLRLLPDQCPPPPSAPPALFVTPIVATASLPLFPPEAAGSALICNDDEV